jgi:hypothetical protein
MIISQYENMRVVFALTVNPDPAERYMADGRLEFPTDVVGHTTSGVVLVTTNGTVAIVGPATASVFPWRVTVNGGVADSVLNVDEYDWYLHKQHNWLELQRYVQSVSGEQRSGSVELVLTASGTAALGSSPLSQASLVRALAGVAIYAQRRSDGRVWCLDLTKIVFSGAS